MEHQLTENERKAIEILTNQEPTMGLHPTAPTKAIATGLNISQHDAQQIVEDVRSRGLVGPQSDVLDGKDDPANHKWIWARRDT
jgi:hypothetical protein